MITPTEAKGTASPLQVNSLLLYFETDTALQIVEKKSIPRGESGSLKPPIVLTKHM